MGLRFYRRIKILPGIRLNFSRSGVSTSVGVRGAHVKATAQCGRLLLPGSGISYTNVEGTHQKCQARRKRRRSLRHRRRQRVARLDVDCIADCGFGLCRLQRAIRN